MVTNVVIIDNTMIETNIEMNNVVNIITKIIMMVRKRWINENIITTYRRCTYPGAIAIFGGMALNNHNDSKMMITKFLIKVRKIQTRKIMTKIKQLVTKIKTKIKINHLQITIHQAQIVMHLDQMKMVITQIAITKTAQLIPKPRYSKPKQSTKQW